MTYLLSKISYALEAVVDKIADVFSTDCRHVLERQLAPGIVINTSRFLILRCHEPSYGGCATRYCAQHCAEMCGSSDCGSEGDEAQDEGSIWEPKTDATGKDKVEA